MDGQNQRNTILAIALSLMVLLGWQFFVVGPQVEAQREVEAVAEIERAGEVAPRAVNDELPGAVTPSSGVGAGVDAALTPGAALGLTSRADALAASPRVPIDTPAVTGSINLVGGRLDDLILKRYRQAVDEDAPPIELLSPATLPTGYFVELGFSGQIGPLPGPDTMWQAPEGAVLGETSPVTLTYDNGAGLTFERTIALDDNYLFTVTDRVTNGTDGPVALQAYGRSTRFSKPGGPQVFVLHEGMIGFLGEEGLQEIDYGDVEDEGRLTYAATPAGWLGITDKYWATSLIPDPAAGAFAPRFAYLEAGRPRWQADFLREPAVVPEGATTETVTRVYAGAKVTEIIDEVGETYAIPNFDLMIDWGWFYFITKPMFTWLIQPLYELVGNFGVAILLATVVIKLIFFPLANKSYVSMAAMKKLQPRMQEIREQHGEDRQAQQRALMELYKTEKINPVAGCWPVLLQIPVFFALYKVLYVTIEMRHAPFFGWIQDLSAPDPSSIWELFGLFPWGAEAVLPAFLLLGVWPIVMGVTMFLQMRLNPMPPDPTQALIFTWMPVVFTFMLSTFPAGLVIYWAWNNTLTILQQATIMKRQGAKIELWDNVKAMFSKKSPDPAE